ncbi:alkaline phosphatase family protein [Gluconacetobacter tumulicola]
MLPGSVSRMKNKVAMIKRSIFSRLGAALLVTSALAAGQQAHAAHHAAAGLEGVPHYDNIIVIEMENRQYGEIIGADPASSPHMTELARTYNSATSYYGITHPSEPNYIAMMAGDQEGVLDDDGWYCQADGTPLPADKAIVAGKPDTAPMNRPCNGIKKNKAYVAHHFTVPNFFAQLNKAGISWSMYNQSMPTNPQTGESMPEMPTYPASDDTTADVRGLYASKHNPSVNFDDIREAADFHAHNRGEQAFFNDLATGKLPRFAYFVPDQCHDDHGPSGPMNDHPECKGRGYGPSPLLTTGDNYVQTLVDHIQASPQWKSRMNVAIVVTFDEDDSGGAGIQGCCGYHPVAAGQPHKGVVNQGGGRIPMLVITNHGVRGVQDDTPYNHYSLLRTMEDAFGIAEHIGHANDGTAVQPADGAFVQTPVVPMVRMFALAAH